MQTFLPFASFENSARCLDGARLRKQLLEATQIYKTITGKSEAWKNHPAVKQWVGYADALTEYIWYIGMECFARGSKRCDIPVQVKIGKQMPPWLGREDVHSSHRSRLLFKGRVDAVSYSLRSHLKVRSINQWLVDNGYPEKNVFRHNHIETLENYCKQLGVKIQPNHYAAFQWTEGDALNYVWPTK